MYLTFLGEFTPQNLQDYHEVIKILESVGIKPKERMILTCCSATQFKSEKEFLETLTEYTNNPNSRNPYLV